MPHLPLRGWAGLLIAIALSQASSAWAGDDAPAALPADRAVSLAVTGHPDIRAAEAAIESAQGARAAAIIGNPQIAAWFAPGSDRASASVSLPLSLTGQAWMARRTASAQLSSATASLQRRRRTVAARARLAYVRASVAVDQVRIASEGEQLAGRLHYAVQRKFEVGEASALDLHLARLSRAQAAVRVLQADKMQVDALRALSEVILQPVAASQIIERPLQAAPRVSDASPPDVNERSDVRAATLALETARHNLSLQRAIAVPPVWIGVDIDAEDGQLFAGPSVSLTLPLFQRNQAAARTAKASVPTAQARQRATLARAQTEHTTARARLDRTEKITDNIGDDGIMEASAALSIVELGVLSGEIDLTTAVLLQRQILDGQAAAVNLQGLVADARLDLLLALDHDALLPAGAP